MPTKKIAPEPIPDGLTEAQADVLDSVRSNLRRPWSSFALAEETGRPVPEVLAALERLADLGHVRLSATGWRTPAVSSAPVHRRRHLLRSGRKTYCGLDVSRTDADGPLCSRCAEVERKEPRRVVSERLGGAVAVLRAAAGLSMNGLATRSHRSVRAVENLENGNATDPAIVADVLDALSRTLRKDGWAGLHVDGAEVMPTSGAGSRWHPVAKVERDGEGVERMRAIVPGREVRR